MRGWWNAVLRGKRFCCDERGAIVVEFAFATPFLLLLLSGAIDLGLALNQSSSLSTGARAGAQYAMRYPSDTDGIAQVVAKATNYDSSTLTITSTLTCECADGTAIPCTEMCGGITAPKSYVKVNVSMPYTSPLPTALVLGPVTLSASAAFRAN